MTMTGTAVDTSPGVQRPFEGAGAELEVRADRLETVIARLRDESDGEFAARGAERRHLERLIHLCEEELRDIADALDRARRGTYGTCEACGLSIPRERLEAMPETRTCVGCAGTAARPAIQRQVCRASSQPNERSRAMPRPRPMHTPPAGWRPKGGER